MRKVQTMHGKIERNQKIYRVFAIYGEVADCPEP